MEGVLDVKRMEESAGDAAELLDAMANSNRLMILCNLANGEMPVNELAERVGMNQSALSHQLSRLRALGLVKTRREGRTIFYRIASTRVEQLLEALYGMFCGVRAPEAGAREA